MGIIVKSKQKKEIGNQNSGSYGTIKARYENDFMDATIRVDLDKVADKVQDRKLRRIKDSM